MEIWQATNKDFTISLCLEHNDFVIILFNDKTKQRFRIKYDDKTSSFKGIVNSRIVNVYWENISSIGAKIIERITT